MTEVRERRADGTDGMRRIQGLLEADEMELLIENICLKSPSDNTPDGSRIRPFACGESAMVSAVERIMGIGA